MGLIKTTHHELKKLMCWGVYETGNKKLERRQVRELFVHSGGLGGALGFPLVGEPAHHPYARPRFL